MNLLPQQSYIIFNNIYLASGKAFVVMVKFCDCKNVFISIRYDVLTIFLSNCFVAYCLLNFVSFATVWPNLNVSCVKKFTYK